MSAHTIDVAALDDLPLTSLQAMQVTLSCNFRRASNLGNFALADDYNQQIGIIQAEVIQRTARLAHNAGMPWTATADTRLQRLARAGETIECIASTLGRTCAGIVARAARFGFEFGNDGRAREMVRPTDPIDGRRTSISDEQQRDIAFNRSVATTRGSL
jgi:hypothetical protein